jgi:hypothetical protein
LRVEADYFHDNREGIFLQREGLAGIVGLTTMPWVNVGKMQNQGLDASMQFNRRVGNVNLQAMGNFTYTQNRLIDNDQPDWAYPYLNRIGKPWNQPFGLIALGLFESEEEIANSPRQTFGPVRPGDIKYLDVNGDGVIDSNDEVAIGYPTNMPGIVYGFGLSAQWRGFDVSTFFQGVGRITIFAEGNSLYPFTSSTLLEAGMHEAIYHQRWTPENPDPNARFPRVATGANGANNYRRSTWRMYDGSFVRLRNAEIGYTIPRRLVERFHITSLRVYASGTNLLTFSGFDLWDPERGTGQGDNYPPTQTLLLGLSVNF